MLYMLSLGGLSKNGKILVSRLMAFLLILSLQTQSLSGEIKVQFVFSKRRNFHVADAENRGIHI